MVRKKETAMDGKKGDGVNVMVEGEGRKGRGETARVETA